MNRRIVITGLGAVTPVGKSVPDMWNLAPDHHGNDDARHHRKEPDDEFDAQNHVLYLAQLGTSRILLFFHITNIKNCASYSV